MGDIFGGNSNLHSFRRVKYYWFDLFSEMFFEKEFRDINLHYFLCILSFSIQIYYYILEINDDRRHKTNVNV